MQSASAWNHICVIWWFVAKKWSSPSERWFYSTNNTNGIILPAGWHKTYLSEMYTCMKYEWDFDVSPFAYLKCRLSILLKEASSRCVRWVGGGTGSTEVDKDVFRGCIWDICKEKTKPEKATHTPTNSSVCVMEEQLLMYDTRWNQIKNKYRNWFKQGVRMDEVSFSYSAFSFFIYDIIVSFISLLSSRLIIWIAVIEYIWWHSSYITNEKKYVRKMISLWGRMVDWWGCREKTTMRPVHM